MTRTAGICLGGCGLLLLCLPLAAMAAEAPAPAAQAETYVVRKGDTLWGIAKDFLKDPVLWPRIQEENQFITNPNRIFPGDRLVVPGTAVAPAPQPEVAKAPEPVVIQPPPQAPAKEEEKPAPQPEVAKAPEPAQTPSFPQVPVPPVPPASAAAVACSPVLLPERPASTWGEGVILRDSDGRSLISMENTVSVGLDSGHSVEVGKRLMAVRPGQRVVDPRTGKSLGRVLLTLGVLQVLSVQDRVAQARVVHSCAAMQVGDRIAPFAVSPFPEDRVAQPTARSVDGFIVGAARSEGLLGAQQLFFLNVGTGQGIAPGDVFAIYRPIQTAANPAGGAPFAIPPERLGEAVVIRATEETSTAVVTSSPKESRPGDRVVLSRAIQP